MAEKGSEAVYDLMERLRKQIDYIRAEYEMTYAEAVGCLELLKAEIIKEALNEEDD